MEVAFDAFNWQLVGTELSPLAVPVEPNYPSEDLVFNGTVYGNDNELLGNMLTTVQPNDPTLVAIDERDGENVTFTLTGTSAGTTNYIYASWWGQQGAQEWSLVGTLSGDGVLADVTLPQGLYACKVRSELPR